MARVGARGADMGSVKGRGRAPFSDPARQPVGNRLGDRTLPASMKLAAILDYLDIAGSEAVFVEAFRRAHPGGRLANTTSVESSSCA